MVPYLSTVVLLLSAVSYSSAQCLTGNDARMGTNQKTSQALYLGQQEFSLAMLKQIVKSDPTSNIFFSPYSTYHAMLLAYFISRHQTENSIKNALRIPPGHDKVDVMQAYRIEKFIRSMQQSGNNTYEFNSANRIYVKPNAGVRQCMTELFTEEIEKLDFSANPEQCRTTINSWVESITKNQIKNLLPQGTIDGATNLVLVNAAYFKGMWASQFNPEDTTKAVFYTSGTEKSFVDMMRQEGQFNHEVSEKLGAHVLEMPYIGNDISMFVFLPPFATTNSIDNVIERLNADTLKELVAEGGMVGKKVVVHFPKFTLERSMKLIPILQGLGVGDLFSPTADLTGLTDQKNIDLGDAIHAAKIEVSEQGTKAAAATALFTFRSSRPLEPIEFKCDHPFVYTIYDRQSQSILFAGVYRKP